MVSIAIMKRRSVISGICGAGLSFLKAEHAIAQQSTVVPYSDIEKIAEAVRLMPSRTVLNVLETTLSSDAEIKYDTINFQPNSTLLFTTLPRFNYIIACKTLQIRDRDQRITISLPKILPKSLNGKDGSEGMGKGQVTNNQTPQPGLFDDQLDVLSWDPKENGEGEDGEDGHPGTSGYIGRTYDRPRLFIFAENIISNSSLSDSDVRSLKVFIDAHGVDGGRGGQGGNGGSGGDGHGGNDATSSGVGCQRGAGGGGTGGAGGSGGPGGPGADGGKGGDVWLVSSESTTVAMSFWNIDTRGGEVGDGGPPGKAGMPGGPGNQGHASGWCVGAGPPGTLGPRANPQNLGWGRAGSKRGANGTVFRVNPTRSMFSN